MTRFMNGDLVYHTQYGAGIVVTTREVSASGTNLLCYVVDLVSGSRLILPVKQAGRLCSLRTARGIGEVLSSTPEDMAVDYRQRRTDIENKINSGDPIQSAEVFRDLAWREHHARLSYTDKEFMNSMKKRLIDILSLEKDLGAQGAAQWFDLLLEKVTLAWSQVERKTGESA